MPKIDGKVVFQKEPESRLSATPPEGQSLSVPDNAQVQVFEKMAQQIREQIQSSPELQNY